MGHFAKPSAGGWSNVQNTAEVAASYECECGCPPPVAGVPGNNVVMDPVTVVFMLAGIAFPAAVYGLRFVLLYMAVLIAAFLALEWSL